MRLIDYVLALDLSTTCTGFAIFQKDNRELLNYGIFKPSGKGLSKLKYPIQQLTKMVDLSQQIIALIKKNPNITRIVIEEVNRHKSRMSGKTLDGFHFVLLFMMEERMRNMVKFMDSDGAVGWRTQLGLRLSEMDKLHNKNASQKNKRIKKSSEKIQKINQKHLSCRFANTKYGLKLNVDEQTSDGDIADAIGLGTAFLLKSC